VRCFERPCFSRAGRVDPIPLVGYARVSVGGSRILCVDEKQAAMRDSPEGGLVTACRAC